ncbi:MAG TPA: DUF3467 domain-containing protein [Candidatus Paceibacterota bacterium]|nr:DUF3467 domain-containing protein [Candidatus Paceibacterota bacterium]
MPEQNEPNVEIDSPVYELTNAHIRFTEDDFLVWFTSGRTGRQYHMTPRHAKRLFMLFKKNIQDYEKRYGELTTRLPDIPDKTKKPEGRLIGFRP